MAGTAVFIIVFFWFLTRASMPYVAQEALLSEAELRFYRVLKQACPANMHIMMKVRLADIITCSEQDWQRGYGRQISGKHIDFVLINARNTEICLCIELDDSSHQRPERQKRDAFVNAAMIAAAVPLLRVPVARHYNVGQLSDDICAFS